MASANFGFLETYDVRLVTLGALAERYFQEDPSTAIVKLRQFAELLAKMVAARNAVYRDDRENFEETLRRLSFEQIIPREVADVFHAVRKAGNTAVHDATGSHSAALTSLKFARQLGIWFHRTYGGALGFSPGSFVTPEAHVDPIEVLQSEIEQLRERLSASKELASAAREEAEELLRAREAIEARLLQEAGERAVWEQLPCHA